MVADSIAGALGRREALLVIDNCEHVVAETAALLDQVLHAAPLVRCLVTSRRSLRIAGEVLMEVPPLSTPEAEVAEPAALRLADSVALFLDRAAAVDSTFRLSAENAPAVLDVCRRLDGVPLAIEMAAARTNVMSPVQIAAALGDRFALLVNPVRDAERRHATLGAALDWSYELLTERTQRAFNRLAVFAGPFGIEDVAAVAAAFGEAAEAVTTVADLVESSMCSRVAADPSRMRYRLLETHREYGAGKLVERGELEAAREAHSTHFLEMVAAAREAIGTPELAPHLDQIQQSYEDVQRSLEWSLDNHPRERTLAVAPVLFRYWIRTGDAPAAGRWGAQMLSGSDQAPAVLRAGALLCVGFANTIFGDPAESLRCSAEACRIYREWGDWSALVTALFGHAQSCLQAGELEAAADICLEALQICDSTGDAFGRADHLATLGLINMFTGNLQAARRFAEEALPLHRRLDDRAGLVVMNALPAIALKQGDFEAAERAAADMVADAAGTAWAASAMSQLGEALLGKGDQEAALAATQRAVRVASDSGLANWFRMALRNMAHIQAVRGAPEVAARLAERSHTSGCMTMGTR
jgi:non-specific serine/threonine protein kinase